MKSILLSLIAMLAITTTMIAKEKPTIIYVFDPLCGWCYGFSPIMLQAWEHYKDSVEFEIIPGGMVIGDKIGPIGTIAPFLKKATALVTQMTGAEFSKKFLDTILTDGKQVLTSVEPSIAIAVYASYKPDSILPFVHALHKEIYINGLQTSIPEAYATLAKQFSIDSKDFIAKMKSKEFINKAQAQFDKSTALGVESFPTLILKKDNQTTILAKGFKHWPELDNILKAELGE